MSAKQKQKKQPLISKIATALILGTADKMREKCTQATTETIKKGKAVKSVLKIHIDLELDNHKLSISGALKKNNSLPLVQNDPS